MASDWLVDRAKAMWDSIGETVLPSLYNTPTAEGFMLDVTLYKLARETDPTKGDIIEVVQHLQTRFRAPPKETDDAEDSDT